MFAFILFLLTLWFFLKTISYAIFEIKKNSNISGGIAIIVIAIASLIFPNIMVLINGFY